MKKSKLLIIVMLPLLFASCEHEDLTVVLPNENIRPAADFIKNNYELSLFSAALAKTGYGEELNKTGPFTVLVPSDRAFNEIGVYSAPDFDRMNADSLKKVIAYHILPRRLRLSDIPTNGVDVRYATLEGSELYASLASVGPNGGNPVNDLYFSGAMASRKDVVLANGTLHVLDKVMKPSFSKTIQQWLELRPEYSVFVKGLKKFNLWDQLNTNAQFTVFAPNNAGLETVGITNASLDAMDADEFLGDLLFGSYILYDRHFFISDSQVFGVINSDPRFQYFLKNNSHYMEFEARTEYPSWQVVYILTLRTGNSVFDAMLKSVTGRSNAKNDNLCSNGLVHHLDEGLVSPEQALKR